MTDPSPFDELEVWFLTGSQGLYGEETLAQVAAQAGEVVRRLDAAPAVPVRIVFQPVLTTPDAIRRACLDARHDDRCIGVIAWMHTFSPAKMWIGGLQALGKPLLHLHTQANESLPWSTIDMDFMNLNQAAHGDREFAFVQTRMGVERKTVFGHVADPAVQASVGRWARAAAGHHTLAAPRARPLRRQHARRRGDRGRQGRGRDALRRVGEHLGRQRPGRRGRAGDRARRSAGWWTSTWTPTTWPPSCARAGSATVPSASRPPSRRGSAGSSTPAASARSRRTSRTWAGCASCPAWRCSA